MTSTLGKFNLQIERLINDLLKVFPSNIDIKLFKEKFLIAKSANPQLILLTFLKYGYPYKNKIMDKDEDFFLSDNLTKEILNNEDLKKDIKENGQLIGENIDDEYILNKALNLKDLWKQMDENDHEVIWNYFKVLIVLCERYVNEKR